MTGASAFAILSGLASLASRHSQMGAIQQDSFMEEYPGAEVEHMFRKTERPKHAFSRC